MKTKLFFLKSLLVIGLLISSCNTDDDQLINLPPVIKAQSFSVLESIADTEVIGTVTATDTEKNELSYSITVNNDELFEITKAGALSLITGKNLDFETKKSHEITVEVTDGNTKTNAKITINVTDVDENVAPEVANQDFSFAEDASGVLGTIVATDQNNDDLTFSITSTTPQNTSIFEISNSGEISLKASENLDYETQTSYTLNIEVSDGSLTTTAVLQIEITDVNEAPVFVNQPGFIAAEDIADTVLIGTVSATDPEGNNLSFGLSGNPSGLFEISNDGDLSLAPGKNLDYETDTSHTIQVRVTDGNSTVFKNISLMVTDVPEVIAVF
ncbi:hypothetical protein ATO12_15400 [Aquimarina atlantica]|uniref:Cadherin domain-containing protein n=1 Tax=Aquimarina atlantica TaxID=1317122 RepID=A0A023BW98_9FLAO|nr:cadherin repeat domain-containing protein [Aquimarina atlantica]EZH74250.1 hypothetical protein ATO12_15400 [Aquimarina atlantica]